MTCTICDKMTSSESVLYEETIAVWAYVSSGFLKPATPIVGFFSFTNVSENVFYGSAGPCQVICNQNPLLMPLDVLRNNNR